MYLCGWYSTLDKDSTFIINDLILKRLSIFCVQRMTMVHAHLTNPTKPVSLLVPPEPDHYRTLDFTRVSKLEALIHFRLIIVTDHWASVLTPSDTTKAETTHDTWFRLGTWQKFELHFVPYAKIVVWQKSFIFILEFCRKWNKVYEMLFFKKFATGENILNKNFVYRDWYFLNVLCWCCRIAIFTISCVILAADCLLWRFV